MRRPAASPDEPSHPLHRASRGSASGLVLAALLVVVWAALGACGGDPEPSAGPAQPNLVLITIDTLRADRLAPYGGPFPTPTVERLAAEGTLFEQAVAPMPVTRPSHFSLFTGLHPRTHGVVDNQLALPEDARTVAEELAAAGYRTGGFPGVVILGTHSGAAQGFEVFEAPSGEEGERFEIPAERVIDRALRWLRTLPPDEPYFLWVHLFDPHMPYSPPEHYRPAPRGPGLELGSAGWRRLVQLAQERGGAIDRPLYDRVLDLYGGEVRTADAALERLILELEARGDYDRTAVLFTADHGECFDNGFFFRHAGCLYDGAMRVPLVLRYPPRVAAGERVTGQVVSQAVAPTLLDLAGIEVGAGTPGFSGPSLLGPDAVAPAEDDAEEPQDAFALLQHPISPGLAIENRERLWQGIDRILGQPMAPVLRGAEQVGVRSPRWKYLLTAPAGAAERGEAPSATQTAELYDLLADPEEKNNLLAEGYDPETVLPNGETLGAVLDQARRALRRHLAETPLEILNPGAIHPELRKQLEALGYL